MPERNENMQQWIEALRGGDFKQVTGSLCGDTEVPGELGYCCLGVAESIRLCDARPEGGLPDTELAEWLGVDLNVDDVEDPREWDVPIAIPYTITSAELAEVLMVDEDNLKDNYLTLLSEAQHSHHGIKASILNDSYLLDFKQIANLLERYGIFSE